MLAFEGQNRFGMKLHAFDGVLSVTKPHDFVFRRAGADFQHRWNGSRIDQQRMIAHRFERARDACENRLAVVNYRRGLAVHQATRAHDLPAKRLADALQAEAHAENRNFTRHLAQQLQRDSGLGGSARSGRDDDCGGMKRANAGDIDGVVALDRDVRAKFAEVLHEVVGKRVVVVDHQESKLIIARHTTYLFAAFSKSRAAASARTIARALFTDSSNSAPGSESATTPPPACREKLLFLTS